MQNNIRQIIDNKNLKIIDILEQTKLSKSYLYDVMNGLSVPSLVIARKIADALGVTVEEVFLKA
jgi:putative transcriptional regulator